MGPEVLREVAMKNSILWPLAFTLISCLAYSSTMMTEATCSSEKSDDFQYSTRRYVLEDRSLRDMFSFKQELN
jgi:hypothetical protein